MNITVLLRNPIVRELAATALVYACKCLAEQIAQKRTPLSDSPRDQRM